MKDYLSRLVEYSELMKEIEIGGEKHLEIIKKSSDNYLKKAGELKAKIASDVFLTAEDKEKMLKKISFYEQQVKSGGDELDVNSFLLGTLLTFLAKEGVLSELIEFLGGENAISLYSQKDFKNFNRKIL
ncbi:MAG: hypothetical protein QW423_02225 [Candidatus Aenigmatarchaeota archaeon]